MITQSAEIAKGVRLNYIKTDKFKTNYMSFNFISLLEKERAHLNALIPLTLMRGTTNYPTQSDINKRLQYLYSGEISARNDKLGEYQIFGLKANMLDGKYTGVTDVTEGMLDMICDIIFNPYLDNGVFLRSYVDGEKVNLTDTVKSEINNKTKYSITRLIQEMCRDEIFSISKYGDEEQISTVEPKMLYEAYRYALASCRIEIYFVGMCDFDAVKNKFIQFFSGIERNVKIIPEAPIVLCAKEVKEVSDTEAVNQGKLCLGFRTGFRSSDKNYHFLQLFSEIYGGTSTSKLFMNVREKMSLCYYCRSIVSQRNGIMIVASGIEAKNKQIAQNEIVAQLESIKQGNISEDEMENAKKSLKNAYMQIYDSAEAMESWSLFRTISGDNGTPATEYEKVEHASIGDIAETASKITLDTVYFLKGEDENV